MSVRAQALLRCSLFIVLSIFHCKDRVIACPQCIRNIVTCLFVDFAMRCVASQVMCTFILLYCIIITVSVGRQNWYDLYYTSIWRCVFEHHAHVIVIVKSIVMCV